RLGHSLANVRIHTDSRADELAQSVQAEAFTTGNDIYVRSGAYDPSSRPGVQLLAHEATHTLQQAAGPVAGTPGPDGAAISSADGRTASGRGWRRDPESRSRPHRPGHRPGEARARRAGGRAGRRSGKRPT